MGSLNSKNIKVLLIFFFLYSDPHTGKTLQSVTEHKREHAFEFEQKERLQHTFPKHYLNLCMWGETQRNLFQTGATIF